ncbi:MAG: hypothetical protein HYV95_07360 [Opitutae bacterium]|nr:hypothetical protein [Opitutae bacterium]
MLAAAGAVPASAQSSTSISGSAPIINFRLPTFTPDGHRSWLIRGSEARFATPKEIDVKQLTLTIFSGDETDRIETMLLSPAAKVLPEPQIATGDDVIRVIDDHFEASGAQWRYEHREKRVSIAKNVRVVFRAELKDFLK